MLDSGAVRPADLTMNVNSDQELQEINAWLERLANNIGHQVPSDSAMLDRTPLSAAASSSSLYGYEGMSPYAVPISFDPASPSNNDSLYPTSASMEHDLYVRSYPVPPADSQQAGLYSQFEMNTMTSPDAMAGPSPMDLSQYNPNEMLSMTGHREHYTAIPDIAHDNFAPDVRTAVNLMSANNRKSGESRSIANKYKHPTDGKSEKSDVLQPFRPCKPKGTSNEMKKNMATLANVFQGVDADVTDNSKGVAKPATKPQVAKEKEEVVKPTIDENKKKNVMDILTSDLSKLTIQKQADTEEKESSSAETSTSKSLYPDIRHSSTSMPSDTKSSMIIPFESARRHRLLIDLISRQINDAYAKKRSSAGIELRSPKADAVPVQ